MGHSYVIILILIGFLSLFALPTEVSAQSLGMSITATADQGSDRITVTGMTVSDTTDVTFVVKSPSGNIVALAQVSPNDNGEFTAILLVNQVWAENGFYEIEAMQAVHANSLYTLHVLVEVNNGLTEQTSVTASNLETDTLSIETNVTRDAGLEIEAITHNGSTTIEIIGTTDRISERITITVIAPNGDVVAIYQVIPMLDGTFSSVITTGGPLWIQDGDYTITALQNDNPKYNASTQVYINDGVVANGVEPEPELTCGVGTYLKNGICQVIPYPNPAGTDVVIEPLAGSKGLNICGGTTGVECFIPSIATVKVGGKVTFSNTDYDKHTFTSGTISDDPSGTVFNTGLVFPGEEAYWEPRTAGVFPYFCLIHPWMNGLIIVSGGVTIPPTYDTTPPKILKPTDITVDAKDQNGVRVTFDVIAIDNIDQIVRPTCNPYSGAIFSVGTTAVTCNARDSAGNRAPSISFSVTVIPPKVAIPDWIKTVASVWCDDKIADTEFISAIQYLIDNHIITVSATSGYGSSQEIPNWVKNNACWWSQDLITGEDFASGIEYLIQKGIIRV